MIQKLADLVVNGAKAIAVFESPHTSELRTGVPLSGDSGNVVSNGLGFDSTVPMGTLVKDGKVLLSIVNSFESALQLSGCLEPLHKPIENLNFHQLGVLAYKAEINRIIRSFDQLQNYKNSYIQRMNNALSSFNTTPRILVCGFIAQAFFEYAYDLPNVRFGSVERKVINGVLVEIFYVEHPSPKNLSESWKPRTNKNSMLRLFLSIA